MLVFYKDCEQIFFWFALNKTWCNPPSSSSVYLIFVFGKRRIWLSHNLSKFRFQQSQSLYWLLSKCVIIQLRLFNRVLKFLLLVFFIMYIVHRNNSYDTFYTNRVQETVFESKICIQVRMTAYFFTLGKDFMDVTIKNQTSKVMKI